MAVASTVCFPARAWNSASFSGRTATTMRSWDSEIQISQGSRPAYFRGIFSSQTSAPPATRADSPTAEDNPPPPQSVIKVMRPRSRASRRKSCIFFWV